MSTSTRTNSSWTGVHCQLSYGLQGNLTEVRHTYSHFMKTMKRRSPGWKLEPQTVEVFEEVTQLPEML